MEPLKASEQLIDCTTSLSYARLVAKMDEIKELYSIYRSTCEGFSVNMTEYVQIFQAKGETTPSHGEETFAIWDSDKNCTASLIISSAHRCLGTIHRNCIALDGESHREDRKYSRNPDCIVLFKMFDFNGIEALSYTDVECLFTYCVTSTCKMYGISSAGIDFSLIKKMILRGVAPDAKVSQKRFAKLCCHRLITDFMKMFRMTELRLVPLIKSNEAIDTLNQIYSDVFFPVFPLWNRIPNL